MKMTRTLAIGTLLLTAGIGSAFAQGKAAPKPGLTLTSPDFTDGVVIPNKYTQADPAPVSPKLDWTNVPDGTVSFVLLLHDPDVGFQKKTDDVLHWMAFNIPCSVMGPGAGAAGPYHHYTFELFALDTKLDLGPDATRADVMKAMDGHVIGKGV